MLNNDTALEATPQTATFTAGALSHDEANVTWTSTTMTDVDNLLETPISFSYGQAPRTELWLGYINAVEVTKSGQGSFQFITHLVGPSKTMRVGQPRFWFRKSVPSAITDLTFLGGLGLNAHEHTYLWDKLSQTDESDWAMVQKLAYRIGFVLYQRYGVLQLLDPNRVIREQGSYATLVSAQDQDFEVAQDRRLIEFNASEISADEPITYGHKVAYFHNETIQTAQEQGVFKGYNFRSNFPVRDNEEAQVYMAADTTRTDKWKQTAEARLYGDTDLYPGHLVDVRTTNDTYYRNKYDGRWLVTKVRHEMDTSQFQTSLSLTRPASNAQISPTAYQSFWNLASRARPNMVLRDGIWLSSWTDPRVRSIL